MIGIMKKMVFVLGVVVSITYPSIAFSEGRGAEVVAGLSAELELTESQVESMTEIVDDSLSKIEAIMASEDSRFKKMRSLRSQNKNKNEAMEEVLNDDQYEQYQTLMKEKREELKASRKR